MCVFTQRVVRDCGSRTIGFMQSRVNKTPIRHERESNTSLIRYRVNGASEARYSFLLRKALFTGYLIIYASYPFLYLIGVVLIRLCNPIRIRYVLLQQSGTTLLHISRWYKNRSGTISTILFHV